MKPIEFNQNDYTVTCGAESVQLLPKEYALLQFLYTHKERALTRDVLLDRVWPMEDPTDRTIDDHIYRLRKKLKPLEHAVSIKTVRKFGYVLTVRKLSLPQNPSLSDKDIKNQMHELMQKYLLYGQGESMRTLLNYQEQLGIEIDPLYRLYIGIMGGNVAELFEDVSVPFRDKLYLYLTVYYMIHFEAPKTLFYINKALASGILPESHCLEIDIIDKIHALIESGKFNEARDHLKAAHQTVEEKNLKYFVVAVKMVEIYLYLVMDEGPKAENAIQEMGELFGTMPFLRELGYYRISQGLFKLQQTAVKEGAAYIDEGLMILNQSRFEALSLRGLHCILFLCRHLHLEHTSAYKKYLAMWRQWDNTYNFQQLKSRLENEIFSTI